MNSRNYGCRITEIIIKGNRAVIMENQLLRIVMLADRGMDIIELLYKPDDLDFMWRSPVRLHRKADYISSTGNSLGNYLDHNSGGWQEILPNGGSECYYKGACLGMHGEISNVPWEYQIIRDEADEITLRCYINTLRSPFRLVKDITLRENDAAIYISEELINLAEEPMQYMWGHHPTVGKPFLDESCIIYTNAEYGFTLESRDFETQRLKPGARFTWPIAETENGEVDFSKIPAADAGIADMIYLSGFPENAFCEVYNRKLDISYSINWDSGVFPYMWMWLVCGGALGYPWYGRTYNLALEPWTSYSENGLSGAIENDSAQTLAPHEIKRSNLCFRIKKHQKG